MFFLANFNLTLYIKSKIHVHAKISEKLAYDMVCDRQMRKKAYVYWFRSNDLLKFTYHTEE